MQIAVTEQGNSSDGSCATGLAIVPVENVERWFLFANKQNKIVAANMKLDVPVLSLAGCYVQKNEQVRWVDQTQYPMIVVASLSAVPQSCRTPLL